MAWLLVPSESPHSFVVETFSILIRPLTLSIRLMPQHGGRPPARGDRARHDHADSLPVPVLVLSTLVCIVQVLVFCI